MKLARSRGKQVREYNFSGGVRGKYAKRYREGTNLVALEPDVARSFRDSESVNEALRALLQVARRAHIQGRSR